MSLQIGEFGHVPAGVCNSDQISDSHNGTMQTPERETLLVSPKPLPKEDLCGFQNI